MFKKKLLAPSMLIASMFVLATPYTVSAAGTNSMRLSSSAGKVTQGAYFTVDVVIEAADKVDVAQANVSFDKNKLVLASAKYDQGQYPVFGSNDTGDSKFGEGYYQASRYRLPPFTAGNYTLVHLTFRASGDKGKAAVAIDSAKSLLLSSGKNVLSSITGVSVELQPAASASQQPLPGTGFAASGDKPATSTPPLSSGNNGLPAETVTLTAKQQSTALAAASKKPAESRTNVPKASTKPKDKANYEFKVLIGLALLTLAVAAYLTVNSYRKKSKPAETETAAVQTADSPDHFNKDS